MIYLDYSATTPISEQALQVYQQVARQYYGNPSSLHDVGGQAAQLLEACRSKLAALFGGEARGVYFTGGGSESNYLAIRSLVEGNKHRGKHLITTQVEHASVRNTFAQLKGEGYHVTYLPVDPFGKIDPTQLEKELTEETILVSVCHANSEIGTVQPLAQIGKLLEHRPIIFHSDCVQTFGKLPLNVQELKLDSISLSSHKIYGPKGVGACYLAPQLGWKSTLPETTHEKGFRPGTSNVPGIAGFVTAAEEVCSHLEAESQRVKQLTDRLLHGLQALKWDIRLEGHPIERLPQHLGLRIVGLEGQYVMLECNRYGLAISTGTACLAGIQEPSATLKAIGKTDAEAHEFIRITLGRDTTEQDIVYAVQMLDQICARFFALRR